MEFATFCYATNFALYFWKRLFSAIGNCSEIFACRAAARTSISALIHSFLFRCVSQPPPLRGTSFHRKEGEPHPRTKAFPSWEGSDARIPLSHTIISSESEKSFSFAVKRCMRANESGKPVFPRIASMVFHANGSAELVRKRIATKIPRQSAHARKGV